MDNGASSYRRFLQGDATGFDEIMEAYQNHVIYFIYGYVHSLYTAEDIAMDTFVELLIHKNRYRFQGKFQTYLFSIARNKALDYLRSEKRQGAFCEWKGSDEPTELLGLEDEVARNEKQRRVQGGMRTLNDDYRAVLYLLYFEEVTYREAADIMKKTTKQIENLAYRARHALRSALEKEGFTNAEWC